MKGSRKMTISISKKVIHRLSAYLNAASAFFMSGAGFISSEKIAKGLHISSARVRYDLSCVGIFTEKCGHDAGELTRQLGRCLGINRGISVALLGDQGMGNGIAASGLFKRLGMSLVLTYPSTESGYMITDLQNALAQEQVDIVVLNDKRFACKEVLDLLEQRGIYAIWNLTGEHISQEKSAPLAIEETDLADSLLCLSFRLAQREQNIERNERALP